MTTPNKAQHAALEAQLTKAFNTCFGPDPKKVSAPRRRPNCDAAARTISLFTHATDDEAPNARDGSAPDPRRNDHEAIQALPAWKQVGSLSEYSCGALRCPIHVERQGLRGDGPWSYRLVRRGKHVGVYVTLLDAVLAAEAAR